MDPITVQKTVETFADFLLKYFVALAAVGALSMAMIELWKKLRDSRTRFHAKAVSAWMNASPGAFELARNLNLSSGGEASLNHAYRELIHLTTGTGMDAAFDTSRTLLDRRGDLGGTWRFARKPEHALFALELDRMLGHIQDAADIALSNPKRYTNLYLFMTHGAEPQDVGDWYLQADTLPRVMDAESVDRDEAKRRADLYARLHQVVKRKLDAFQLFEGDKWVNWNQLSANIAGMLVLFVTLLWVQLTGPSGAQGLSLGGIAGIVIASLLGGMLAPIAKDVIVALRKVRQGG